jgi:uncharacterized protein with HEPN domain
MRFVSRSQIEFLADFEESCRRIIEYTHGLDRDRLFSDHLRFDGVLHNLHVIGEAVKRLPDGLCGEYPAVPWREIAGTRDVVAHAYFALDLDILWRGVQVDIPRFLKQVRGILAAERGAGGPA